MIARGLPRVSATMRLRTSQASPGPVTDVSNSPASDSASPSRRSSAKPGSNELVEGGEAELHFALDALQMGDLQVQLRGGLDIFQERRLAHTRLAAQHEHAAHSAAGCLNDLIEAIAFFGSGEQSAFS